MPTILLKWNGNWTYLNWRKSTEQHDQHWRSVQHEKFTHTHVLENGIAFSNRIVWFFLQCVVYTSYKCIFVCTHIYLIYIDTILFWWRADGKQPRKFAFKDSHTSSSISHTSTACVCVCLCYTNEIQHTIRNNKIFALRKEYSQHSYNPKGKTTESLHSPSFYISNYVSHILPHCHALM